MKIDTRKLRIEQQELLRQQAVQLRLQGKSFKEIGGLERTLGTFTVTEPMPVWMTRSGR